MDENLLFIINWKQRENGSRWSSAALNETEENVDKTIKDLEKNKTIYGYHTLINWDKTNHDVCTAVIQVNAKPERDYGYDRIAKKIYNFPEVDTMYLLAGIMNSYWLLREKQWLKLLNLLIVV